MQYGKITSNNLFQHETRGNVSEHLVAFVDWNQRILVRGFGTLLLWVRRSRQRSELRRVLGRDDHFFQDIGISRATMHHESRMWFWQG